MKGLSIRRKKKKKKEEKIPSFLESTTATSLFSNSSLSFPLHEDIYTYTCIYTHTYMHKGMEHRFQQNRLLDKTINRCLSI